MLKRIRIYRRNNLIADINSCAHKLLRPYPESYYWIGMLLADGNFSQNKYTQLAISVKDLMHMHKYANFVGSEVQITKHNKKYEKWSDLASVRFTNYFVTKALIKKYDIKSDKTTKPPNVSCIANDNLFMCMLIGLIDGDGCISKKTNRNNYFIRIKLHPNWLDNLNYISKRLHQVIGGRQTFARINKQGYAEVTWCGSFLLKAIKQYGLANKLPILERKWNRVHKDYKDKEEYFNEKKAIIVQRHSEGVKPKKIIDEVGMDASAVYKILRNLP